MSSEIASSYPPIPGCDSTVPGYTSINFTTQSLSVPLVEAYRFTSGTPLTRNGAVSGAVTYVSTSVRPSTNRWSSTSQCRHASPSSATTGRVRYGTGFAGSETYSSYSCLETAGPCVPPPGASNESAPFAAKYSGFDLFAQPSAHAGGHDLNLSQ